MVDRITMHDTFLFSQPPTTFHYTVGRIGMKENPRRRTSHKFNSNHMETRFICKEDLQVASTRGAVSHFKGLL